MDEGTYEETKTPKKKEKKQVKEKNEDEEDEKPKKKEKDDERDERREPEQRQEPPKSKTPVFIIITLIVLFLFLLLCFSSDVVLCSGTGNINTDVDNIQSEQKTQDAAIASVQTKTTDLNYTNNVSTFGHTLTVLGTLYIGSMDVAKSINDLNTYIQTGLYTTDSLYLTNVTVTGKMYSTNIDNTGIITTNQIITTAGGTIGSLLTTNGISNNGTISSSGGITCSTLTSSGNIQVPFVVQLSSYLFPAGFIYDTESDNATMRGIYPITCSMKIAYPSKTDDFWTVNPGFKVQPYTSSNYKDMTTYNFDNYDGLIPKFWKSDPPNKIASYKVYYRGTEITQINISGY